MTGRDIGRTLLIATHNDGKLAEIEALLAPHPIDVLPAKSLGLAVPDETETSFLGNARIKAHAAARASDLPALADDSGIEVDALGGAPGVHTADWAEAPGGRNFLRAMTRTWEALEASKAPYPRTARFRCTLVLAWPDGAERGFEGALEGRCVWPPRGARGHGYDPMFEPDGADRTLAEMSAAQKNAISHRARALRAFIEACLD